MAKKTWVGYIIGNRQLPAIKPSIIGTNGITKQVQQTLPQESLQKIDYWYAKNYEPLQDIKFIIKNYRHLGSNVSY